MTLLVVGSCPKFAFVATDRRGLEAKPGGTLLNDANDDTNKALFIKCNNAALLICWAGLARLANGRRLSIDKWLQGILWEAKADQLAARQVVDLIANRANDNFAFSLKTVELAGYPGFHEFVIVAWHDGINGQTIAGNFLITNYRDGQGKRRESRSNKFRILYREIFDSIHHQNAVSVFVGGVSEAVGDEEVSRLQELLQTKPSNKAIAGRVGAIIRKASKHPFWGKYISEECRGLIMRPEEHVTEEFQWPQMTTGQVFGQIIDTPIILPGLSVGGVWAATGELGKIFKDNYQIVDVFYTLDTKKVPIEGRIECDYLECIKILERMFRLREAFTLQLEDGRKLNLVIREIETINHQKRFKVVAEGDFLVDSYLIFAQRERISIR